MGKFFLQGILWTSLCVLAPKVHSPSDSGTSGFNSSVCQDSLGRGLFEGWWSALLLFLKSSLLSIRFTFGILQIDQSVLEALPPDLREQIQQVYAAQQGEPRGTKKKEPVNGCSSGVLPHPVGTVLLQIPESQESNSDTGINVIALPAFSQVK